MPALTLADEAGPVVPSRASLANASETQCNASPLRGASTGAMAEALWTRGWRFGGAVRSGVSEEAIPSSFPPPPAAPAAAAAAAAPALRSCRTLPAGPPRGDRLGDRPAVDRTRQNAVLLLTVRRLRATEMENYSNDQSTANIDSCSSDVFCFFLLPRQRHQRHY